MSRIIYGIHPVEELLRSGREVVALYLADEPSGPSHRGIIEAARRRAIPIDLRPREELQALAEGGVHQGVVAVVGEYRYLEVEELLDAATAEGRTPLLVVLDSVQDPHNLGAIVRSAHVLGAHGVVIPKDRAVRVTPTVVKASAGATEHTPIALCTNVARAIEQLKGAGIWTVAAVADGGEPPWALDLAAPTALVLGAEGKGLRPLVLKTCDLRARIPMVGRVASLNVSTAAAVLLYEAARQRAAAG